MLRMARLHECLDGRILAASVTAEHQTSSNPRHWRYNNPIRTNPIVRGAERFLEVSFLTRMKPAVAIWIDVADLLMDHYSVLLKTIDTGINLGHSQYRER